MKATGIVRRIDDLGRIVIPKEIRRTLRVSEGDPMEIYMDGDSVVFKKYDNTESTADAVKLLGKYISEDYDLKCSAKLLVKIREMEDILKEEAITS